MRFRIAALHHRQVGINQPYEFQEEQWGGLFDSAEAAERELLRLRPDLEVAAHELG